MTTLPSKLGQRSAFDRASVAPRIDQLPRPVASKPKRYLLASAGVGCVAMAGIGVILPGMPTTVFLILAAWCFARSCPWLTDRLIRNRFFGPFLRYIEPGARMPRRAKVISCVIMWAAILGSSLLLASRGTHPAVIGTILLLGLFGTWFIVRQGRAQAARRNATHATT